MSASIATVPDTNTPASAAIATQYSICFVVLYACHFVLHFSEMYHAISAVIDSNCTKYTGPLM